MIIKRFSKKSSWIQKIWPKNRAEWKRAGFMAALVLGCIVLAAGLFVSMVLAWISRDLPDPNTLITREMQLSTKIYDRTGTHLLYEVHGDESRTLIQLKDLPPYVAQATVAIEDKNFYNHHGISWRGMVRAVVTNLAKGEKIKGTSTLTQQLVKNAVLTNERSYSRKLKEILLSLQIERIFTKEQILQMYLNEIPYGSTMYGIESASQSFFGKSAKDLTRDEAALLAAIPQAPDIYSPYGTGIHGDNREKLVGRQHYILNQMAEQGYISRDEADTAIKVDTLKKLMPKKVGNISAPHFVMYVKSLLEDKYGQAMVENKGLKVITTLDWEKQQIAEEEVRNGVEKDGKNFKFTNAALVALNPKNGEILAMVGSHDFFDTENDGQVNVVLQPRQPGSSFKPIVYAASFIKGYTPDTILWDVNTVFKTDIKDYEPKNYNLKEYGPITVRKALQGSLNIPAVKMLYLTGVGRVLDFAESLGYTTFGERSRFGLSLVLGGGEVKLLEHANAYAAFAAEGTQYPTAAILKVEDATGKTLEEYKDPQGKQVFDKEISQRISDILSDNNARAYIFGQTNYLTLPGRPVAVKTGTTNNFHDAWTVGYTPSLVSGVWVGNNKNTEMSRGADGSRIAAPIWRNFMQRALNKTPVERFNAPPPIQTTKAILTGKIETPIKIDKVTGKLATNLTPSDMIEERLYREAHDTLYYVDKDDPQGPAPTNPGQDPQFANWESAVQSWAKRNNWLSATSTAPTEYDDVHTADNVPQVTINSPSANATLASRTTQFQATASSPRRIVKMEASSEGVLIGSKIEGPWTINASFPNSIDRGYHDVTITAYDDVGNRGQATVTVNLAADPAPLIIQVTDPSAGQELGASSFPRSVTVTVNDLSGAKKLDLYTETSDGSARLVGSAINPGSTLSYFSWVYPGSGKYALYAVMTDKDNNTHPGERTYVTVN